MRVRIGFIAGAAAVSVGLLWLTELPLGVPGEWTWNRIRQDGDDALIASVLGGVQAIVVAAIYLAVAWFGLRHIERATRWQIGSWLLALAVAAGSWLIAVQETPPEGYRLTKAPWVLYYPAMTGYFHKARYEISDTKSFLRDYEKLMSGGDVLHVGTHPPGLFVLYRGLISLTREVPAMKSFLLWSQPQSVRDGLDVIDDNLKPARSLTDDDRAVLWLGALLAHASVCWVFIPLFAILRQCESRETAWRTICFWPLVPAVAMFLPKDDVLFVGLVMTFLWCWLRAVRAHHSAASFGWGFVAGCCGLLSLCLSLVFLPIGLIALLAGAFSLRAAVRDDHDQASHLRNWQRLARRLVPACIGGAVAIAVGIVMALVCYEINLLVVWRWNIRNHAAFYSQYPRTMWKWLPVNAIELAFALGLPLTALVMAAVMKSLRSLSAEVISMRRASMLAVVSSWSMLFLSDKYSGEVSIFWMPLMPIAALLVAGMTKSLRSLYEAISLSRRASVLAVVGVWGILWLSGKNSGEAARLWIPLMPLAVWLLPGAVDLKSQSDSDGLSDRSWLGLLALQAAVCMLTVMRVSGFHFGG